MAAPISYLPSIGSTPEARLGRQDGAWWIPPHSSNPAMLQGSALPTESYTASNMRVRAVIHLHSPTRLANLVSQTHYQSNILARRTEASRPYSRSRRGRDSPPHPEGPPAGCHVIIDTSKNSRRASIDRGPPPQNYGFTQDNAQASSSSSAPSSNMPAYNSQHPAHFVRRQPRIQVSSLLASDSHARYDFAI